MGKKAQLLLLIVLINFLLTIPLTHANTTQKYTSEAGRFSIVFSNYFTKKKISKEPPIFSVGAASDAIFYEVLYGIEAKDLPRESSQNYMQKIRDEYVARARVEYEEKTTLHGEPALRVIYLTEENGQTIYNHIGITAKNNVWYTLKVSSYERHIPQELSQHFFASFKFLK